jgi:hypothetical protein
VFVKATTTPWIGHFQAAFNLSRYHPQGIMIATRAARVLCSKPYFNTQVSGKSQGTIRGVEFCPGLRYNIVSIPEILETGIVCTNEAYSCEERVA